MKKTQSILLTLVAASAFALPAVAQDTPHSDRKPEGPRVPPLVALFDKNKDGKLDASEIDGAAAALRSLDKDNNGEIAREEFPRPQVRQPNRRGPGGPGGSEARGEDRRPNFDGRGPGRPGHRGEEFRRDGRRPGPGDRNANRSDDRRRGPESFGRFDNRRDDRRDYRRDDRRDWRGGHRDFRHDDRRPQGDRGNPPRREDFRRDDRGFHGPDRDFRRPDNRRPEGDRPNPGPRPEFRDRDGDRGHRGNFGPDQRRDFRRPGGDWNRPQGERGPDRGPRTGDNQVIEANEIVSAE